MIDCHAFRYLNKFDKDSLAYVLGESPRDQWKWWWSTQRALAHNINKNYRAELGEYMGVRFFDD